MQITEFKALAPNKYTMRVTHPTGIEFITVQMFQSCVDILFGQVPGAGTELLRYEFSLNSVTNKYVVSPYPQLLSRAANTTSSDIARQANTSLFILYALLRNLEERGKVTLPKATLDKPAKKKKKKKKKKKAKKTPAKKGKAKKTATKKTPTKKKEKSK